MFSSPLYAEWTKVNKDEDGNTNYIDFESIKKVDGYVYWWILSDIARPTIQGHLSSKTYNQGDCKLFRFKYLSWIFYTEPMGAGDGDSGFPKDTEWNYPPPNSVMENILRIICSG
tara:strand:- start:1509 stop:1853 length:345 start_codon:yes stop_codon:yes gene_type:complete